MLPVLAGVCLCLGGLPLLRWAGPSVAFLFFMLPLPYRVEMMLSHPLRRLATEGSTYALQALAATGTIALERRSIIINDRDGLARHACECYAAIRRITDRELRRMRCLHAG